MGNTGSVHNLHNEYVDSELNSYYTQQYLKRTFCDSKKVILGGCTNNINVEECKVLPSSNENLKLRSTTNGAILQAGGTISFRAKEQLDIRMNISKLDREKELYKLQPMRRYHTLILDSKNDSISPPLPSEFRRSQTMFHIGCNSTKLRENIALNFDYHIKKSTQPPFNTKVNKYNKKRKAPPAPTKLPLGVETSSSENNLSVESKNTSSKTRIYATKTSKSSLSPQHSPNQKLQSSLVSQFQRCTNIRTSINSRPLLQSHAGHVSKLPYRREKSFEAILLRQKDNNDLHNTNISTQNKNVEEKNRLDEVNVCCVPRTRNTKRESELKETQSVTNKDKTKYQQSRIPQLKCTFYFGMEGCNNTVNLHESQKPERNECNNIIAVGDNEGIMSINHNIKAEEEIVDNGILVHVRPTLPRRQPETPRFSPSSAWRNLLEEQQRLQHERTKLKQRSLGNQIFESPICLSSKPKMNTSIRDNWTPQQDLEEEEDDYEREDEVQVKIKATKQSNVIEIAPEKNINSMHIFSLSLPRDVHLQSQMKSSLDYAEQENSLKSSNCWLVPGFNSLQKFKTHLSKNVESSSNIKCTCAAQPTSKTNGYHIQTIFDQSYSVDSKSHHLNCELHKTSSRPLPRYRNDNWLLHKSKTNVTILPAKIAEDPIFQSLLNSNSLADLQPKSLTNICGGKHIVYLPGHNEYNVLNNDAKKNLKHAKEIKSTYKRQRQRQELVRESLQDLAPVQNIHQSNVEMQEKNTHRFSFQSTLRILEKRRLAEKLSKDAELQEAQRLNELEAMKRVEEDFQRKRAPEKNNLRNQLRLHLKANTENEAFRSLPLNINQQLPYQLPSDINNNLFCKAKPDSAVLPNLDFTDNIDKIKHSNFLLTATKRFKELKYYETNCKESATENQSSDLQCNALLIEPYLHSII